LVAWAYANPGTSIFVDLESQTIEVEGMGTIPFQVEPRVREKLLNGYTVNEELSKFESEINAFESSYREQRPWIYQTSN